MSKRSFAQEMESTRTDVGQIVMWCGVIALHQRYGIGPGRQDRLGKSVEGDSLLAQRAGLHWMMEEIRGDLAPVLPAEELEFRVPLLRAPKSRREQQLAMAGNKAATVAWLLLARAVRREFGFGPERLRRLRQDILDNYRQLNQWCREDGPEAGLEKLRRCAERAIQEELRLEL